MKEVKKISEGGTSNNRTGMVLRSGKLANIQSVNPESSKDGEVVLLTRQQTENRLKEGFCPYCCLV